MCRYSCAAAIKQPTFYYCWLCRILQSSISIVIVLANLVFRVFISFSALFHAYFLATPSLRGRAQLQPVLMENSRNAKRYTVETVHESVGQTCFIGGAMNCALIHRFLSPPSVLYMYVLSDVVVSSVPSNTMPSVSAAA